MIIGSFLGIGGCIDNPYLPSYTSTPTPTPSQNAHVLWKNGVAGNWGGSAVSIYTETVLGGKVAAVVSTVPDTVNGDPLTLEIPGPDGSVGGNPEFVISSPVTVNFSAYYQTGHVQFDICSNPGIAIQYALMYGGGAAGSGFSHYNDPYSPTFSHVSIPLNSFIKNVTSTVSVPFEFYNQNTVTSNNAIYLNAIEWTSN